MQRLSTVRNPARCERCGRYMGARPGAGGRLLFTVAQHGTLVAAIALALTAASWWPLIVGAAIGIFGLHVLLLRLSPFVIVTKAPAASPWRRYLTGGVWIGIAILAAAAALPFLR